jgi:hypothetical protein
MLVKILEKVPEDKFNLALKEIEKIDWGQIQDNERSARSVFSTSKSIHLRTHKIPPNGPIPKSIQEWSMIVECADKEENILKYCHTYNLAIWACNYLNGIKIGRIMIVNLLPGGKVNPHIDPYDYFEVHSRFHIPLITNDNVVFLSGPESETEHMPVGMLSRLNNRTLHSVENRSDALRVHIIIDIAMEGGNTVF